uniref:PABS domain-containing protein n=1 Tax=Parascaris equorum TaxID=6256 RepID=A0A914RT53_PAREQ
MNITVIELEHVMLEMARRYFGLSEDSHQHVINMDGLDYLGETVKQGREFDAIYIDACSTAFPTAEELPCPVHGFLIDQTIGNLKAVLKKTGKPVYESELL